VTQLALIDVVPSYSRRALAMQCTACGWTQDQDPGGPTLATLVERASKHLTDVHPPREDM
jgi:hypothetical protein